MSSILTLIKALPALLGLIKALEQAIKKSETDRTVNEHLEAIKDAFASGNPALLNSVFNSTVTPVLPVGTASKPANPS